MATKTKVLAFDLGNVLFAFDYRRALNKIKDRMKLTIPEVIYSLYNKNFTIPFEKGLVSGEEFHRSFVSEFGVELTYEEFHQIWCEIFFPITEVIELARNIKKRYRLYLISNINQLHFEYLFEEYHDVFALFEKLILSYQLKSVKPELKIYQALAKAAGTSFADIIYIDDRQDLIVEANKLGINCIQFIDYQQLVGQLNKLGLAIQ